MQVRIGKTVATFTILLCYIAYGKSQRPEPECDSLPTPENVVSVPPFSEGKPCPDEAANEAKVQYEAVNDELPLFREETSPEEFKTGAKYPQAVELYVDPEPTFVSTRETIVETSYLEPAFTCDAE